MREWAIDMPGQIHAIIEAMITYKPESVEAAARVV